MVEIVYKDIPFGANEEAIFTAGDKQPFSTLNMYNKNLTVKNATTEANLWKLDGSFEIMKDIPQIAYWSGKISGANGTFQQNPSLTIKLATPCIATGLTFSFSVDTCEIEIKWYLELQLLAEKKFQPNQLQYVCDNYVQGFNKIVITFTKTQKPHRFVKLDSLTIGQIITFDGKELSDINVLSEVNPISTELSIDTLNFILRDKHSRTLDFQKRQPMYVYQHSKLIGTYYIDTQNRTAENIYEVSCIDAIGALENSQFYGGIYNDVSAKSLIKQALNDEFEGVFEEVEDVLISGYLPICSKREAIAQIAFAMGVMVTTQNSDKIRFVPLPKIATEVIPDDHIFYGGNVENSPLTTAVCLTSHSYKLQDTAKKVFDGQLNGESTLITFSQPYSNYTVAGGNIENSGANFITVNGTGVVTVSARPYEDTTRIFQKQNPASTVNDKNNIVEITQATLVSQSNVNDVLNRLYDYYLNTATLTQSIVVAREYPGQKVVSLKPFAGQLEGYINRMDFTFTNKTYADITIIGKQVALQGVYSFAGELQAGTL